MKKDIFNLLFVCHHCGLPEVAACWESVVRINERQMHRVTERLSQAMFNTIAGKCIAIFGKDRLHEKVQQILLCEIYELNMPAQLLRTNKR